MQQFENISEQNEILNQNDSFEAYQQQQQYYHQTGPSLLKDKIKKEKKNISYKIVYECVLNKLQQIAQMNQRGLMLYQIYQQQSLTDDNYKSNLLKLLNDIYLDQCYLEFYIYRSNGLADFIERLLDLLKQSFIDGYRTIKRYLEDQDGFQKLEEIYLIVSEIVGKPPIKK